MCQALGAFPDQEVAQKILGRYYIHDGKKEDDPYASVPMFSAKPTEMAEILNMAGAFSEVWLAKKYGGSGPIGMNLLTKVEPPTMSALFGAMLAGVDYVAMGAGIPRDIPRILDSLSRREVTSMALTVEGATMKHMMDFDPAKYSSIPQKELRRPSFLAIVSLHQLAGLLARRPETRPDGFIVEGGTAGGHNAPPRPLKGGRREFDVSGQPVYHDNAGDPDWVDLEAIRKLGLPFWLAGGYGSPEGLETARQLGARGVQVGTPFAFCDESGLSRSIKEKVVAGSLAGTINVRTDPKASPTGFPFKVTSVDGSLSDPDVYSGRQRVCDLGYLRVIYERTLRNGKIVLGYRCASEPAEEYTRKGGSGEVDESVCLCNGLMDAINKGQRRRIQEDGDVYEEPPVVTAGDVLAETLNRFGELGIVTPEKLVFSAATVINFMRNIRQNAA
jgi:NAD(P)H-dependent flavin oxidoreductase YrpB (nitropropane dioxygenase family)